MEAALLMIATAAGLSSTITKQQKGQGGWAALKCNRDSLPEALRQQTIAKSAEVHDEPALVGRQVA